MRIAEYQATFNLLQSRASVYNEFYPNFNDYQKQLNTISSEACEFFSKNADVKDEDYQQRKDIFLAFDVYLKELKKKHIKEHSAAANPNNFFSLDDDEETNETTSLLDDGLRNR